MADFCRQCSINLFGEDCRDLAGIITEEQFNNGSMAVVLCEGCGPIQINHLGECLSEDCLEHGHKGFVKEAPLPKKFVPGEESDGA